jgi:hypothetical protein
LGRFVNSATQWPFKQRREFVNWLCEHLANYEQSDAYGLSPHPLATQLVVPTLEEWIAIDRTDSTPCRWAGMFFSKVAYGVLRAGLAPATFQAIGHLRDAITRNPRDEAARIRLIELVIGDVEFNCHHLPASYLGSPERDLEQLAEARSLLGNVADASARTRIVAEIDHVSHLVQDWLTFCGTGETDFDRWCRSHGREYRWVRTYYYTR